MGPVDKAFANIPRHHFVLDGYADHADIDAPLPIGFGQTISQPTTVKMMLEWLEVEPGDKILDVGSGSGWTTALLGYLTGSKGRVYAVERIPELVEFGKANVRDAGIKNAQFHQSGEQFGLPQFAPYDRILVSAAGDKVPQPLIDQLKVGGKMVIPIRNDILEIEKLAKDKIETAKHPGFVFVPLV